MKEKVRLGKAADITVYIPVKVEEFLTKFGSWKKARVVLIHRSVKYFFKKSIYHILNICKGNISSHKVHESKSFTAFIWRQKFVTKTYQNLNYCSKYEYLLSSAIFGNPDSMLTTESGKLFLKLWITSE